jgi:phage gp37-like protein
MGIIGRREWRAMNDVSPSGSTTDPFLQYAEQVAKKIGPYPRAGWELANDNLDDRACRTAPASLDWALTHARAGLRVFPVKSDKRPHIQNWPKRATTNEALLRKWWRRWPNADAGWAVPAEVVVVDLDEKESASGVRAFERLMGESVDTVETPQASTPSGGRHLVFSANGRRYKNGTRIGGMAIDLRTVGGYVVLPGSNNGREWLKPLGGSRARLPAWLRSAEARVADGEFVEARPFSGNAPHALQALDEACGAIARARNGEQEETLNRKCYRIGGLVAAGILSEELAEERLSEAAAEMPAHAEPWGDLKAKVRRSLMHGMARPWEPSGKRQDRPIIRIAGGELAREADEVGQAFLVAGLPIFVRAGELVSPAIEEVPAAKGRTTNVVRLRQLTVDVISDLLSRYVDFQRYDGRAKKFLSVDPPERIAKIMLARGHASCFPKVAGVVTTPTLRSDGSILRDPGYDPAARLYLVLDPRLKMPVAAESPTREDASKAINLLRDLLSGFPFVTLGDRAVALSGIMTAVLRGAMSVAPMHVFRAHAAGTGKSLLVDVASAVASGRCCPVIAAGRTEEETEKRLGALLREGVSVVSIDNVNGELGGDALAQMTERPLVRVRILGKSEAPEFECRSAIFATGNNVVLVADMTRRAVVCTLDAQVERPELRHFAFDPLLRVLDDRGVYVAACLTIARAYRIAGMPSLDLPPIGSYGEWSAQVRAPLVWLGEVDPVTSMETAREEDPELGAIRELFALVPRLVEDGALDFRWPTRRLIDVASGNLASLALRLVEDGADLLEMLTRVAGEGRGVVSSRRLGKWLSKICGRVVDGQRLVKSAGHAHGVLFSVEPAGH